MMAEEIVSPPWLNDSARVDTLYDRLKELHQWASHYREVVNQASDHQAVAALREIPRKAVHDALPVVYHYANFMSLRRIREHWDALVRDYEDSWDTKVAFAKRRHLICVCVDFLNGAWLSQEAREAKQATAQDEFLKHSIAKGLGLLPGTAPVSPDDPFGG